jgi:dTDP-4-dehydrorhamnose reductase
MSEELKKEKPKGPLGKLKDKVEDSEEQLMILSTLVRLGILIWSGGILTLNYVTIPGLPQQKIDPTFIASVFTGVLATFGVQTAKKSGDGTMKMNGAGQVSKADLEKLIERAANTAPAQTIRIEQAPMVIAPTTNQPPKV